MKENSKKNIKNEANKVEQNVNSNKLQKSGKVKTVVLMLILLILMLAIGVSVGLLLKTNNISENSVQKAEKADNSSIVKDSVEVQSKVNTVSYKDLDGLYIYENNSNSAFFYLDLYEDGTFNYWYGAGVGRGTIGNYTVENDNILLNQLFDTGTDTSITVTNGILKLKLNSDGTITDTNNLLNLQNTKSITLTKAENTKENKERHLNSNINMVIDSSDILNQASEEINEGTQLTSDEKFSIYSKGVQEGINKLNSSTGISENERKNYFNPSRLCGEIINDVEELPIGEIYINDKKEAYIAVKEKEDQIKILDNAIDCGVCGVGNGGSSFIIWAIDVNGNLYTQNYDLTDSANRMNFKLAKKQGLKNIVSVASYSDISACCMVCFDIEGNMYQLF